MITFPVIDDMPGKMTYFVDNKMPNDIRYLLKWHAQWDDIPGGGSHAW